MNDKRQEKGVETYNKIIEAAIDMIAEQGLSSLSAAKLATRAGVSKSNVFHHFDKISDVPVKVLETVMAMMMSPLETYRGTTVASVFEAFEAMAFGPEGMSENMNKVFMAFYSDAMFNPVYKEMMSEFLELSEATLAKALLSKSSSAIDEGTARTYAGLIIGSFDGLGLHQLLGDNMEAYKKRFLLQKELIVRALDS